MSSQPIPSSLAVCQGTFRAPDSKGDTGSGVLKLNGAQDTEWLEIQYKKGGKPLVVKSKTDEIYVHAGSKLCIHVADPAKGLDVHHQGDVEGHWGWLKKANAGVSN